MKQKLYFFIFLLIGQFIFSQIIVNPVSATTTLVNGYGTNIVNTINGVGLTSFPCNNCEHASTDASNSFVGTNGSIGTVDFDLGSNFSIGKVIFWNLNEGGPLTTFGVNNVNFYSSLDGITYTIIPEASTSFLEVTTYSTLPETVTFNGVFTRYIRMEILSNHGYPGQVGFAEIAFETVPATHLNFDGVNDYVTLTNESNFDFTNQMTVEFWMNSNVMPEQWDALVAKGDNSWRVALTSAGTVAFAGSNAFSDFYSTTSVTDGNWHHVAVTYDGANAKIYIDGSLESQLVGTANITNSTYAVSLGENLQMPGRYYTGNMDELRIWNTARTNDQINASKNCELQGNETGLVAYYQFNQGFDQANNAGLTTLNDITTNANNGTLSNFALNGATSNWLAGSPVTTGSTIPNTPIVSSPVTYNQGDTPSPLTATIGINGTDLLWYTSATGGTGSSSAPTPSTATAGSTSYWVSSTNGNGCESDRVEIVVTVNTASPAAPTTTWTTQVYTGDDKTIADIQVTGSNIIWYDSPTGGSVLAPTIPLLNNGTAYASQTVGGVESTDRLAVTVKRISENTQTLPPASTVANLVTTPSVGTTAQWFSNATGGTALASTDVLTNGVYYVEQQENSSTLNVEQLLATSGNVLSYCQQADGKIIFYDNNLNGIYRMDANGSNVELLISTSISEVIYAIDVLSTGKIVFVNQGGNVRKIDSDGSNEISIASLSLSTSDLVVEANDKILISSAGNSIYRIDADGSNLVVIPQAAFYAGIDVQADGKIVFTDGLFQTVNRMDSDGSNLITLISTFSNPNKIKVQSDGKIVYTEGGNLKRIDANGGNLETLISGNFYKNIVIEPDGSFVLENNSSISRYSYVASTSNRVPVNVVISSTAAPTTTWTTQVYTGDDKTIADIQVTGSNIIWYDSPTGGSVLAPTIPLLNNGTAYASQTVGGVESTDRLAVTVKRISDNTQTLPPASTVANLVTTPSAGTTAQWFSNATGGTALASTDVLTNGVYYVEQQTATSVETLGSGFYYPFGVAIQPNGKIVVADNYNNAIKRMDSDGTNIVTLGSGFFGPSGVAIQTTDGKIVVADTYNNVIKRMDADGTNMVTLGSGFSFPFGVAIQADGKIVVADYGNHAIKRMNADGSNIETLGSGFNYPRGVTIQADGKIVVADSGNNLIKRMDSNGTNIETLGSGFNSPSGVSIQTTDGKIVVADSDNNSIKRMDSNGTNIEILGSGFNYPYGTAIQADDKIVVVDTDNNAIKRITEASTSNRVPVNVDVTTLGTSNFDVNSFKIYPNPSTGIFKIDTKEEVQIEVYDLVGKLIKKENIHIGVNSIDVTNYASGIYLLKVNKSGKVNTYRLVKQ